MTPNWHYVEIPPEYSGGSGTLSRIIHRDFRGSDRGYGGSTPGLHGENILFLKRTAIFSPRGPADEGLMYRVEKTVVENLVGMLL